MKLFYYLTQISKIRSSMCVSNLLILILFSPYCRADSPQLAVVLDASASMCGFVSNQGENNTYVKLIKELSALRGPANAVDIFLLLQTDKEKRENVKLDLKTAPPNILSKTTNMASSTRAACHFFYGFASNLEMVFDKKTPFVNSDALVLVTDAEILETDREKFVRNFKNWADSAPADSILHAGFAYAQFGFQGYYYPVSPEQEKAKHSYFLDFHQRPLYMFWFAKSLTKLATIKSLVSQFASGPSSGVQILLPQITKDTDNFETENFPGQSTSLLDLIEQNPILEFTTTDKNRNKNSLRQCITTEVTKTSISIVAKNRCNDDKAFFDQLASFEIKFKTKQLPGVELISGNNKLDYAKWTFTPNTEKLRNFAFKRKINAEAVLDLSGMALNSDDCSQKNLKAEKNKGTACMKKIAGKTFQIDLFSRQLRDTAIDINQKKHVDLEKIKYQIKFELKK